MADFSYNINKEFGLLNNGTSWVKKLCLISWNGGVAKYDIRNWAVDGSKMGKGITLTKDELIELKKLLNSIEID